MQPAVTARKEESIVDVARRMRDEHVGCVVVVAGEPESLVPVGMLTDRDVVVRAVTSPEFRSFLVADVMSEEPVRAWENDDLFDVLKRMRSFGVRRMPLVDDEGTLRGIVTLDDVVQFLGEQLTHVSTLVARGRERELKPV